MYWIDGQHFVFQRFWCQSCRGQDWMLLVMLAEEKFPVCVLWGNNSHQKGVLLFSCKQNDLIVGDRRCMFYIQLRHDHFESKVWDYILPCCIQGWTTHGYKHIHSHFCCWREWWYKSLINQCKWFIKLLSHHSLQQQKWIWICLYPWVVHPWIHHGRI